MIFSLSTRPCFFPQGSLQQPLRDSTAVRWPGTKGWPVDTEVR